MKHDLDKTFIKQLEGQHFQIRRDQQTWVERYAPPERTAKVVVNFGCDANLTPHLMVETVSVLAKLGVDFVAVAGPQWCCGMPFVDGRETGSALTMTSNSAHRMAAFAPTETVHWCGAWWPRLAAAFPERAPVELARIPAFFLRALREREVRWEAEVRADVLMHLRSRDPMVMHDSHNAKPSMEASVPEILRSIPGVRVVGHAAVPSRGLPCELDARRHSAFDDLAAAEVRAVQDELAAAAAAAGANMIVTAHQGCHREWGKFTSPPLPIRHFISLLAEALGVGEPDHYHEYWQLGDVDEIARRASDSWRSWGMSAARARQVATTLFDHRATRRDGAAP